MTASAVERLTQVVRGGVTWEYARTDIPGNCDLFGWCDGDHQPQTTDLHGVHHGRYIASALRDSDGDLVEIAVVQWKADPAQPWRLGASCGGWPNKDLDPVVAVFTYPSDLAEAKHVFLKVPDADAVASALRLVASGPFADALDAAVKFARKLNEETQS